ncbi:MAG TPA: chitobiase/beta-hexosaminidase C-terminal domain-containing protein [Steroidobacteraceae bacterium]|nr:chitobiase/beta-hexosaminidase C-terminal domain-containing protein [Steroidobacteraceae bacterium]
MKAAARIGLALLIAAALGCAHPKPFGLSSRSATRPYLQMPRSADGKMPLLLSQTGVFSDTRRQIPNDGLIPYDINVAFWSDRADKSRWVAIPSGQIAFSSSGEWHFPAGTVFVKTFDLPTDAANPGVEHRLETRLLIRDAAGGVYGVVYKWRADGSDADLLTAAETENIAVKSADGTVHRQTWYYPSRQDCLTCHTANAGSVLGIKTRQLNRSFKYPSGVTDNELRTWAHLGLFNPTFKEQELRTFAALAPSDDAARSLEDRARSYLDANCAQCHRPGGTVANFDARYPTPLAKQQLIDGPVLIDQGIDRPRIISPRDIWRSIAYMRVDTTGDIKMPPLARETIDPRGVQLLREWINSLPGRDVLAPPEIRPAGGSFAGPVEISLSEPEAGADVRYTLDGSVPGMSDAHYQGPVKLTESAVMRTRAFKEGFTRSITAQQVFIIGK